MLNHGIPEVQRELEENGKWVVVEQDKSEKQ